MKAPMQKADPATFEIVKNSLYKIAEEMRVVLAKTAYSPILKSAGDYSCGVFDARGEMVAQGPDLPIHLGSMPDAVRAVVAVFAADVHDGDVFIHNDPYFGGSHLPDVNVVRPAFHDSQLLGYACLRAHWPDVGSATPGSYGAVTQIFGEGLRIPPLRLIGRGALNGDLEKLILANVRTPDERKGDLGAQLAATLRATERLNALAKRYGAAELIGYMAQVMDYSERLMRATLKDMPDGEGVFEDFCDGDGIADDASGADARFRIRLSVRKTADRLIVDFAGTDPQVKGPMNAPLSVTASGVFCGLKTAVDPNNLIPPNSGCWRSIEVRARKDSVVNAEFPAPVVYANHEISHRVADMVMGALVNFMPEQVMACSQGTSAILTLGGVDPRSGRHYVSYETMKGGFGARPNKDGINCIASGISNTMNTPVEVLEMAFPVRVERYEVNPDSGGAGRYRGGCGARRVWRMRESADVTGALCMERMTSPPFGLRGGKAGAAAVVTLTTPDGVTRHLPSKGAFAAPAGSVIDMITPGSGGFGPVAERDPAAIGRDLLDGYVGAAAAQRDYGVNDPEALRTRAAAEDEA
jgi:N-methylhydantoinase B